MILPGTDFDDEFMDNDYTQENGSDDEDNEVVCTSNIGLESVTRDGISGIVKSKVTDLEQMELWTFSKEVVINFHELFNCLHNQLEGIRRTVQSNLFGEQGDDVYSIYTMRRCEWTHRDIHRRRIARMKCPIDV